MPSDSRASWADMALRLSPSVRARKRSAPSAPMRRRVSSSVPSPLMALPWKVAGRRSNDRVKRSTIVTSWPVASSTCAILAPTRPQPTITALMVGTPRASARVTPRRRTERSSGRTARYVRSRSHHRTSCDRAGPRRADRRHARRPRLRGRLRRRGPGRGPPRADAGVLGLRLGHVEHALGRLAASWATPASRGRVQSISTTWTATTSAWAGFARSSTTRRIRASDGPPLRATTALLNEGTDFSLTGLDGPPDQGCASHRIGVTEATQPHTIAPPHAPVGPAGQSASLASSSGRRNAAGSSRRYGTLVTTVSGRPSRARRSSFVDWL